MIPAGALRAEVERIGATIGLPRSDVEARVGARAADGDCGRRGRKQPQAC